MPIGIALCDGSLENGIKWLVHYFNLSVRLRIVRIGMLLLMPLLWRQIFYHFVLKVPTMVSDKLFRNTEPSNNLVEYKVCGYLTIKFNRVYILYPFREIMDNHYNVMIPPRRSWVAIHKVKSPLGEGTDSDNRMERGGTRAHITCKHMARVALLDCINAILKWRWISGSNPVVLG